MKISGKQAKGSMCTLPLVALSSLIMLITAMSVRADEADAKRLLKAMSDYVAAQKAISFDYDAILEVVTKEGQKLALAGSGSLSLERPDKVRVTRSSGFANVEMFFDGKTLTLLGKDLNIYAQEYAPGTLDHLVDDLRFKYKRPLPGADLLLKDSYEALTHDVVDIKDLGSGVIGGVECDSLAFRTKQLDWQIWIAHGKHPYPCRYVINTKSMTGEPEYSIQVRNWKAGDAVAATDYSFKNSTHAKKIELEDLKNTSEFPGNFDMGEAE